MGSFHLGKMSFKNLFGKPATKMYPIIQPAFTPMTKGQVKNDIKACIFCGICERKCPAGALKVDRAQGTWTIDPFACVQCYTCVRACPKKSLSMVPEYTPPSVSKYVTELKKPELTPEEKAAKEAADKEKAERVAAARAKAAAKKAEKNADGI